MFFFFLFACGGGGGEEKQTDNVEKSFTLYTVKKASDMPDCVKTINHDIAYVENDATYYVCVVDTKTKQWIANSSIAMQISDSTTCTSGGRLITMFYDNNSNKIADSGETTINTFDVCNGANGTAAVVVDPVPTQAPTKIIEKTICLATIDLSPSSNGYKIPKTYLRLLLLKNNLDEIKAETSIRFNSDNNYSVAADSIFVTDFFKEDHVTMNTAFDVFNPALALPDGVWILNYNKTEGFTYTYTDQDMLTYDNVLANSITGNGNCTTTAY